MTSDAPDPFPLISFWFGDWDDHRPKPDNAPQDALWWGASPETDAILRDRFAADHLVAARRASDTATAAGAVATILLLDQVPRNIFRGTPHMFATDRLAQNVALALLDGPLWAEMPPIHRYFALMPLMHAEALPLHDRAVEAFGALVEETKALPRAATYAEGLDYEHRHRRIIEQFGRYPHRNEVIGRPSTPDEIAFLAGPGSRF